MTIPNVLIDEFMKGKVTWRESPTHEWAQKVKPQHNKLTAFNALFNYCGKEILSGEFTDEYANKVSLGILEILEDLAYTLNDFEKELP